MIYTDIKKLEMLKAVASFGSISKAAERMGYSQPGLTGMLNRLEDEIGFPLLDRGSGGVVLTARGRELMPAIDSVLEAYSGFETAADVQQKYRFDLKYIDYIGRYRDNGTAVTSQNGFTTFLKDRGFVSLTFKTTF